MIEHDCQHRDAFDSLAAMRDAGGARVIVTSPPYPDARTDASYGVEPFDTTLAGYNRLGRAVFDALMPGGVCAFNINGPIRVWREDWTSPQGDARVAESDAQRSERSLISFKVAIDWAEHIGFRYVESSAYVRAGQPGIFGPRWRSGFELVHVFSRPGREVFFDGWGYTLPAKNPGKTWSAGRSRSTASACKSGWMKTQGYTAGDRAQLTTAIQSPTGPGFFDVDHAAPFSKILADAFVLCYSQPGDIVGDPFVGSGTVAFSCHRHGRRFIGGDLGTRQTHNGKPCGRRWADIVNDGLRQQNLF